MKKDPQEEFEKCIKDIVAIRYTEWDSISELSAAIHRAARFLEFSLENVPPFVNGVSSMFVQIDECTDMLKYDKKDKRSDMGKMIEVKTEALNRLHAIKVEIQKETLVRYKPI